MISTCDRGRHCERGNTVSEMFLWRISCALMPRPSSPLLSREAVVRASIEIIDAVGLEAFSLPRLADHLGVRAPSLYHHFADKNEILSAVAQSVASAAKQRPRHGQDGDWAQYFVTWAVNFRQSVLKHRNVAMVLVQHIPRDVVAGDYEEAARVLRDCGVPAGLHVRILDGLQALVIGALVVEAGRPAGSRSAILFPDVSAESHPALAAALDCNELNRRQLFEETVRGFLAGVTQEMAGSTN